MKASVNTISALSDIDRVTTTGQVRRIGSQMLLALSRKEISATDVEAGAKMVAAISLNMQTEIKLALAAITLREKGAQIGKVAHLGKTIIGDEGQADGVPA